MKLYINPLSPNSRKVDFVARHLELEVERVVIDFANPEHRATLLTINPNGKIPALEDGDMKLWESNAIAPYLCGKVAETSLWPKSNQRYDIMRWMSWQLAHFGPPIDTFAWENMLKGMFGQGAPDEAVLAEAAQRFAQFAQVLDDHLTDRAFVSGDGLTLADAALAAPLTYAEPSKLPLEPYPNILRWRASLDEIPAWKATAPQR